jgi:hypothetical protein
MQQPIAIQHPQGNTVEVDRLYAGDAWGHLLPASDGRYVIDGELVMDARCTTSKPSGSDASVRAASSGSWQTRRFQRWKFARVY